MTPSRHTAILADQETPFVVRLAGIIVAEGSTFYADAVTLVLAGTEDRRAPAENTSVD